MKSRPSAVTSLNNNERVGGQKCSNREYVYTWEVVECQPAWILLVVVQGGYWKKNREGRQCGRREGRGWLVGYLTGDCGDVCVGLEEVCMPIRASGRMNTIVHGLIQAGRGQ